MGTEIQKGTNKIQKGIFMGAVQELWELKYKREQIKYRKEYLW